MITVIYGNNYTSRTEKIKSLTDESFIRRDGFSVSITDIDIAVKTESFFSDQKKYIIFHTQENLDLWKYVISHIKDISESQTISLVLVETELSKSDIMSFQKAGVSVIECTISRIETKKQTLSPFALSDAIFACNKKDTWMVYMNLVSAGVPIEEIDTAIFWAFKTLALVSQTQTLPKEKQLLDIKPFVMSKITRGLPVWKNKNIVDAYSHMITIKETYKFNDDYALYLEKGLLEVL